MWLDDLVGAAADRVDDRMRESMYARGVTDEQISMYRLGYLDRKLPEMVYPEGFLKWCHNGDKLDDVVVLPLTNTLGEIKGVQFRHVERSRSGYTDYISEKGEAVLFGLGQALSHVWSTRRIMLVEGAFDLFPLQRWFPGITATLTAHVLESLARVLRRLNVSDILLGYDNDDTGREALVKIKRQYGEDFKIHPIIFPRATMVDGKRTKDPADLWETWGEAQFGSYITPLIAKIVS